MSYGDWEDPTDICWNVKTAEKSYLTQKSIHCVQEKIFNRVEENNMMWTKLFNVVGIDDLEGMVFARCTTYEKAVKAKEYLENNEFEDMIDIVQDEIPVDVIEIDSQLLEL